MSNMRQILKRGRPSLRMEDGGNVQVPQGAGMDRAGFLARNPNIAPSPAPVAAAPSGPAMGGAAGMGGAFGFAQNSPALTAAADLAHENNLASGATTLANLQKLNGASSPTATPGVSPMPAAGGRDAAWGVKMGMATGLLNSFHPMAVPGLEDGGQVMTGAEHGGEVPGKGRGDKIHTLLEPDEIVVSNKMQKKMPGLREGLMDLREQTLADQGMTVAEADAKARSGGGALRAQTGTSGFSPEQFLKQNFPGGAGDLSLPAQQRAVAMYSQPGSPSIAPEAADPRLSRLPEGHGLANSQNTFAAGDEGSTWKVDRNGTATPPNFKPQLGGPATAPAPGVTPQLGTAPSLRLGNEQIYTPGPLAPDRMSVDQMNAPGVVSRAAAAAANAPSNEGLGNPRMDQLAREAEIFKARLAGRAGPLRGSPLQFSSPAMAPKPAAAPAPLLDNVVPPEAAPKATGMNRVPGVQTVKSLATGVKNAPGKAYDGLKNSAVKSGEFLRANPGAVNKGLMVAAAIPGQLDVGSVLADPLSSKADVASQQGSSAGRYIAQATGMIAGGALGSFVTPVAGTAVGGIAGGLYGGEAYDMAERGLKKHFGNDGSTPIERTRLRNALYTGEGGSGQSSADFARADPRRTDLSHRGLGFDDPRRLDMDPSRQSLGASRDLTNELSGRANGRMPDIGSVSGLRDNVVYKTVDKQGRVTYSGRNVGVNKDGETQMVDGKGANLKMLNGNNPAFVRDDQTGKTAYGNSQGQVYDGTGSMKTGPAGDPVSSALQAAAQRGDTAALEGYYASKGQGFGGKSYEQIQAAQEEANSPKLGDFGYFHHQANKLARDQLRMNSETTRRGQDMDLEGRLAPTRLAQMQAKQFQQIMAAAGKGNADPVELAVKSGAHMDVIKQIQAHQTAQQTLGDTQSKQMDNAFTNIFDTLDEKGHPVARKDLEAVAAKQFRTLTAGKNLNPTELAANRNDAIYHAKAIQAMQSKAQLRNTGWQKWMPWGEEESIPSALPESGNREKVGWFDGTFTGHGLKKGDHTFGGQELDATTDQEVLNYLDRVETARKGKPKLRD